MKGRANGVFVQLGRRKDDGRFVVDRAEGNSSLGATLPLWAFEYFPGSCLLTAQRSVNRFRLVPWSVFCCLGGPGYSKYSAFTLVLGALPREHKPDACYCTLPCHCYIHLL
jgi:hypothetical protein